MAAIMDEPRRALDTKSALKVESMSRRREQNSKLRVRQVRHRNAAAKAQYSRHAPASSKRSRGVYSSPCQPFSPPEDWYEPVEDGGGYRFVVQLPGDGYRHVVTPEEIRDRLAQLPEHFVEPLEVVQLSQMTRKKHAFPCYGMQWGATIYLYPLEESLTEHFYDPPKPGLVNESQMYGGRWIHEAPSTWKLIWTEQAAKDFYLNNILIHELGHLLDERNSSNQDRERYAEWFAIQHGYLPSRARMRAGKAHRRVVRRHHSRS